MLYYRQLQHGSCCCASIAAPRLSHKVDAFKKSPASINVFFICIQIDIKISALIYRNINNNIILQYLPDMLTVTLANVLNYVFHSDLVKIVPG